MPDTQSELHPSVFSVGLLSREEPPDDFADHPEHESDDAIDAPALPVYHDDNGFVIEITLRELNKLSHFIYQPYFSFLYRLECSPLQWLMIPPKKRES